VVWRGAAAGPAVLDGLDLTLEPATGSLGGSLRLRQEHGGPCGACSLLPRSSCSGALLLAGKGSPVLKPPGARLAAGRAVELGSRTRMTRLISACCGWEHLTDTLAAHRPRWARQPVSPARPRPLLSGGESPRALQNSLPHEFQRWHAPAACRSPWPWPWNHPWWIAE